MLRYKTPIFALFAFFGGIGVYSTFFLDRGDFSLVALFAGSVFAIIMFVLFDFLCMQTHAQPRNPDILKEGTYVYVIKNLDCYAVVEIRKHGSQLRVSVETMRARAMRDFSIQEEFDNQLKFNVFLWRRYTIGEDPTFMTRLKWRVQDVLKIMPKWSGSRSYPYGLAAYDE